MTFTFVFRNHRIALLLVLAHPLLMFETPESLQSLFTLGQVILRLSHLDIWPKTHLDEGEKKGHVFNLAGKHWMLLSEFLELNLSGWIWMTSIHASISLSSLRTSSVRSICIAQEASEGGLMAPFCLAYFCLFWFFPSTPSGTPVSVWISPNHPWINFPCCGFLLIFIELMVLDYI